MTSLQNGRLATVAAAVAFALAAPAMAQEEQLTEVTVTGSRIVQAPGMFAPTPVTSVQADELKQLAPTNLIESLTALPVFSANTNQQQALGGQNSGGSNVNLHGAGANRTLTLLDGRRVVSSNRFGTVDVNSLPDLLLNNVETVTGGASASYGTDAVAGVVNFKLDTRFEGVKLKAQGGTTSRHDGDSEEYGIAIGHGFFGNRAHFIGSLQYATQDAISDVEGVRSRPWFRQQGRVTNPNTAGPSFLRRDYVAPTNFTTRGMFIEPAVTVSGVTTPANAALNRMVFNSTGTSLSPLAFYGLGARDGGCLCQSLPTQDLTANSVSSDDEVAVGFRRVNGFARLGFDVTDNIEVFAQGMWGENAANQRRESVALVSANVWQGRIFADNAFLPTSVANLIATTTPASRATAATGGVRYADMSVFIPDNELNAIGDTRQVTANAMSSVTLGFRAKFADNWTLDGFIQQGRNRQDFNTINGIRVDRLFVALDAVADPSNPGRIACRAALPQYAPNTYQYFQDCVPINLFGGAGTVTPEAARYIRDDYKVASQWIEQNVAELTMSGDLGFGLPAGTISSAFGVSYRKDKLDQRTVDPTDEFPSTFDGRLLSSLGLQAAGLRGIVPQQGCASPANGASGVPGLRFVPNSYCGDGNSSAVQFSSLRTIGGESDVKEAFTEFQIPLLRDIPFIQRLETNLAARWADYSGSGNVWAYKGGLSWEIDDQFRIRGTRSRDVRAANLRDRFDQTRGGFTVTDRFFNPARTVSGTSFSGGNPDVAPEKADTTTVGIVFQPSFFEGFQASVDWWNIDISDAITQLTSQQLVDRCVAGDASLCQYVHRAANNDIIQIDSLFINLNNQKIEGYDIELGYRRGIEIFGGGETIGVRLFGTRLMHNITQAPGGTPDEQVGQIPLVGLPKWKATGILSYANGPVSGSLIARYIGPGILDRTLRESSVAVAGVTTIDDNHVGSATYMDFTLNFSPSVLDGLRVYGTVQNLLDHAPPQTPGAIGRTGILDSPGGAIHDQIGRRYTVGLEYKF